jgi:large subunit ribosomal protein L10
MDSPRAEKVAVVDEVRERFASSDGALLTEYRGIDVVGLAELRQALRAAGGDYKIYKNTLVRLAVNEMGLEIDELLVGPTAIAFVQPGPDGRAGDAATVAKALRDFARRNEALVVKGGVLGDKVLSADDTRALAELPSREVLFAEFAGSMEYLLSDFAGLLDNKLREFTYAMEELLGKGTLAPGEAPAPAEPDAPTAAPDASTDVAAEPDAPTTEAATDEAPAVTDDASAPDAPAEAAGTSEAPETDTTETEPTADADGGDPSQTEES